MSETTKEHISQKLNTMRIPIWRTVAIGAFFMVGFYLFWLIPSLNDIKDRSFAHQLEIAEKERAELHRAVRDHPNERLNELYLFISPKLKDYVTFDTIEYHDMKTFFDTRKDAVEFSIVDLSGQEKIHITRDKTFKTDELKNILGEKYFQNAVVSKISYQVYHGEKNTDIGVIAAQQFKLQELGSFIFTVKVNIGEEIENFAEILRQEEGELTFLLDDNGIIIEAYNQDYIGVSMLQNDFIKKIYEEKDTKGDENYQTGVYTDIEGNKFQATALEVPPVNFVIVVEESYKDFWKSWNRFLFLTILGIGFFVVLVIFLTQNTIKMFYFSAKLLQEKTRTESIISNLETGIIEYDADFRITLVNPRVEAMLRIPKEQLIGLTVKSDDIIAHPELRSLVEIFYPAIAEKTKTIENREESNHIIELKVRGELDVQVTTIPIFDATNNTFRYLKVLRDVSRENAIAHSKSEFISVAAHQLRTPLSAIKWVFRLVLDEDAGPVSNEQREYLQKGYDSNERIIKLVGDMLDVARIEEGRFGFEFYFVDLIGLVQKTIDGLKIKAQEKNITINFEKPDVLGPIKLDPVKIELVLQNLLDNALKYTHNDGIITIKIEIVGPRVRVSIKDTGIGIPAGQKERLFVKFFRGTNAVRLETEGSGLGLFIVKNILLRHGGTIEVESEENIGSTFFFTLPLEERMIPKENELTEFVEGL